VVHILQDEAVSILNDFLATFTTPFGDNNGTDNGHIAAHGGLSDDGGKTGLKMRVSGAFDDYTF
jgi:hypothetical protein